MNRKIKKLKDNKIQIKRIIRAESVNWHVRQIRQTDRKTDIYQQASLKCICYESAEVNFKFPF